MRPDIHAAPTAYRFTLKTAQSLTWTRFGLDWVQNSRMDYWRDAIGVKCRDCRRWTIADAWSSIVEGRTRTFEGMVTALYNVTYWGFGTRLDAI